MKRGGTEKSETARQYGGCRPPCCGLERLNDTASSDLDGGLVEATQKSDTRSHLSEASRSIVNGPGLISGIRIFMMRAAQLLEPMRRQPIDRKRGRSFESHFPACKTFCVLESILMSIFY